MSTNTASPVHQAPARHEVQQALPDPGGPSAEGDTSLGWEQSREKPHGSAARWDARWDAARRRDTSQTRADGAGRRPVAVRVKTLGGVTPWGEAGSRPYAWQGGGASC